MPKSVQTALAATAFAALIPAAAIAACLAGAADCPIDVEMARGTDTITLTGTLTKDRDCCAYALQVRGGQTMVWRETGATVRTTIRYPNGDQDGPGLPPTIPFPVSGLYVFSIHPNLMADGAFGPFSLTITIR